MSPPEVPERDAEEAAEGERLRALYHELPAPPPSEALKTRLRELTRQPSTVRLQPRRRWQLPASLAASIAVAGLVGLLVHYQGGPQYAPDSVRMELEPAAAPPPAAAVAPADQPVPQVMAPAGGAATADAASAPAIPLRAQPQAAAKPRVSSAMKRSPLLRGFAAEPPAPPADTTETSAPPPPVPAAPPAAAGVAPAPPPAMAAPMLQMNSAAPMAKSVAPEANAVRPTYPDTADGWFGEIRRLDAAGQSQAADRLFQRFRQRFPDDPRAQKADWREP